MSKIIVLSLILAMVSTCGQDNNLTYLASDNDNIALSSWMKKIPDNTPVAKLSIPGTHDTGAYVQGGPLIITQDITIAEQLDAGIRAMDIRLRAVNDSYMQVYHGIASQKHNFEEDVLPTVINFLRANPSETIIMSVKKEGDDINSPKGYVALLREILNKPAFNAYIATFSNEIKLADVRGKILFMHRDNIGYPVIGANFIGWRDNAVFTATIQGNQVQSKVHVQDCYKVPTLLSSDINFKHKVIRENLAKASESTLSSDWFITFTSGTGLGAYPNAIAYRINKPTANYINQNNLQSCGIVFMDFAGWDDSKLLTKAIIDCNFRLLTHE
ncbi:MAG: phosphatidylinositol-specific phospholipase C [Bacteroidia bacterium]|nr:phosphatidylinositol-specific phospholipase C [Bacteroidia bacterium]